MNPSPKPQHTYNGIGLQKLRILAKMQRKAAR